MNTGDKVVISLDQPILDENGQPEQWEGVTGTILPATPYDPQNHYRIEPDEDRPDGAGKEWFYWPDFLISKVD